MKSIDLKKHVPQFTWKTSDGEKWIYDGDRPVGALYEGPYPSCLHDLRLVPGGPIYIKRGQFMSPFGIAWRMGGLAFLEILVLWGLIVVTTRAFWRIRKGAAILMLPYLVWVTFAAVLCFVIWRMNPEMLG